jgi:NADH-quinone oxidoreductase subunit L
MIVFVTAIGTAFLTALYTARMCIKTFWGTYRGHGHPHESAGSMVTPLWILAGLACVVGFLGFPVIGAFKNWVFVPGEEHHGFEVLYNVVLPVAATASAVLAGYIAYMWFYKGAWRYDLRAGPFGWMYTFVENKYYLDDIYLGGIVKPIQYPIAQFTYWTNQHLLDAVVNGTATGTIVVARHTYDTIDQDIVDFMVNGAAGITGWSGGLLKYIQTGHVQRYAAVLFAAVAVFVGLFALT